MYATTRYAAVEQRLVKESLSWERKSREHVWKQRTVRLQWLYLFVTILGLWVSNNRNLTQAGLSRKKALMIKDTRRLRIWEQKCSWVSMGSQNWEASRNCGGSGIPGSWLHLKAFFLFFFFFFFCVCVHYKWYFEKISYTVLVISSMWE